VVVIHHHAINLNPSILLHPAKKTIGQEHTISEFPPTVSPFPRSHLTTLNTPNKMVTLQTHVHTSKIRTEPLRDLTEMTGLTSKIMAEEVHNIWPSASLLLDKEQPLHADTAEDVR
jgi:hypothetical protein